MEPVRRRDGDPSSVNYFQEFLYAFISSAEGENKPWLTGRDVGPAAISVRHGPEDFLARRNIYARAVATPPGSERPSGEIRSSTTGR